MTDVTANTDTLYCANHPTIATSLRCNRCNKPICHKCAVLTPVGLLFARKWVMKGMSASGKTEPEAAAA